MTLLFFSSMTLFVVSILGLLVINYLDVQMTSTANYVVYVRSSVSKNPVFYAVSGHRFKFCANARSHELEKNGEVAFVHQSITKLLSA